MDRYNSYTTEDFLDDDAFIAYCKQADAATVAQWNDWLQTHPASEQAFQQAYTYLTAILRATRVQPPPDLEQNLWTDIREGIAIEEASGRRKRYVRLFASGIAACLCLLVVSLWYLNSRITVSTTLGEHRTITLPDNSQVTLNANSSLTWYRAWWWRRSREVWLSGEGLFKVQHLNKDSAHILPGERFTAYAGNLQVQVLGTTFNIKERRKEVSVALLDGKVRITALSGNAGPVILQKGEVFNYGAGQSHTTTVTQLTNPPQAWVERKIIASGMTVQDIINNYEDTYGVRIILDNPALAQKTIDGTISIGADDNLLFMLANILNADIERKGKEVYLRSR